MLCIHFYVSDSALVVGFEQTAYTVDEVDDYQLVCIVVLSGDVDGREIILDYTTSSGTASRLLISYSSSYSTVWGNSCT